MTLFPGTAMVRDARISSCGKYRYLLARTWDVNAPLVGWIMLNPSTADAEVDDPTIRRCVGFARAWGYGGIAVVNLFSLRTPDPKAMMAARFPQGLSDDEAIVKVATSAECAIVVAAWGKDGAFRGRGKAVANMLKDRGVELQCLGVCGSNGHPRHPLYLKSNSKPYPLDLEALA